VCSSDLLMLAFFGGEPLLEPKLIADALGYARDKCIEKKLELHTAITTNGTLVDDDRLELLRRHGFKVKVSIDGGREAQDKNRRYANGRSSYDVVAQNVRRMVKAGLKPLLGAVIDPSNAHLMGDSFDELAALGTNHITFAPNFTADWTDEAKATFEEGLDRLGDRFIAHMRSGGGVRVDPLMGKMITHLDGSASARAVCRFGLSELAVAPSGRLYPCDRMVNEDDDDTVCLGDLDRGIDAKKRDSLLPARREEPAMCNGCDLKARCKRYCGCANYETTGDAGTVSPLVCWFEQAFIDQADRVGNALYTEQNAAFLKLYQRPVPTAGPRA